MTKTSLQKNSNGEGHYSFRKGISPKVNVIALLGFELPYYDVAAQRVSHYASLWTGASKAANLQ